MPSPVNEYVQRTPLRTTQEHNANDATQPHSARQVRPHAIDVNTAESARLPLVAMLRDQGTNIIQEWRQDAATGSQKSHDLSLYFAGKIDQHNTMIEATARAYPELQQFLPEQLDYARVQQEIMQ